MIGDPTVARSTPGGNETADQAFVRTALHRVRQAETGSAAGLLNAVQQFGSALGVASVIMGRSGGPVSPVPSGTSRDASG